MKTYTQSYSSSVKPLPVPTPFIAGESLTSWLLRASFNQGCDYSALLFYHWSEYKLLRHDYDKGFNHISPKIHEDIAILMNTSREFVDRQTLVYYNQRLGLDIQKNNNLRWVIPASKSDYKRTNGQPYCFKCFREGEIWLKLQWRYSWYVYCDKHRILLDDTCPNCSKPYQPHSIKIPQRKVSECPHCHADMSFAPTNFVVKRDALEFQQQAQKALDAGEVIIFGEKWETGDWFELMLFYMNFIRKGLVGKENNIHSRAIARFKLGIWGIPLSETRTGLAFDLLPIDERLKLMAYANQLATIDSDTWLVILNELEFSQSSLKFGKNPVIPKAFLAIYHQLPITNPSRTPINPRNNKITETKPLKPKSAKAVLLSWQRLQVKIEKVKNHGAIRENQKAQLRRKSTS